MRETIIRAAVGYTTARELSETLSNREKVTTALVDQIMFNFLQVNRGVEKDTLVSFVIAARKTLDGTTVTPATVERQIRLLVEDGALHSDVYTITETDLDFAV